MINKYGEYSPLIIRLLDNRFEQRDNRLSLLNKSTNIASTDKEDTSLYGNHNNDPNSRYFQRYVSGKPTGIPWIDDFTFKRDSTGPLTRSEQEYLDNIKGAMLLEQKHLFLKGSSERVDTSKWLDEDGYPRSGNLESARRMVEKREKTNDMLRETLAEQGITLKDEDKFSITIDFNNHISVHGHSDANRGALIESALNAAGLGESLMLHIYTSDLLNNQCTNLEHRKYTTNNTLMEYTGYSIDQLSVRSDGIFTDDGKNISTLLSKGLSTDYPDPEHASMFISYIVRSIREIENSVGIDQMRNISLTIDYRNGGLCDVNTTLGFGSDQLQWYDQLFALRGNMDAEYVYACRIGYLYDPAISANVNQDSVYSFEA